MISKEYYANNTQDPRPKAIAKQQHLLNPLGSATLLGQ